MTLRFLSAAFVVLALGCEGPKGSKGPAGPPGDPGDPGDPGLACWDLDADGVQDPLEDLNGDGVWDVLDCNVEPAGGLQVSLAVSAPPTGGFFVAGDSIVATIELNDSLGNPIGLADLARANLYLYGPQDRSKTKTASQLLDTSNDRSVATHHYVDLSTTSNGNLAVDGNVLTFTTEPVSTEEAGTYTFGFWAVRAGESLAQSFELANLQLGTATVEGVTDGQIVGNCADCHLGAASGKFYFHHIDPGSTHIDPQPGSLGNWALDFVPPRTCKSCHNNDGYAAFYRCDDGSLPDLSTDPPTCGGANLEQVPDPLVRRVHGVHNGENLTTLFNIDETSGDFHDYTSVVFPAAIENCTKCHLDDSWLTPSRQACGACHDALDFTTGAFNPPEKVEGSSCVVANDCTMILLPSARACTGGVCYRTAHTGGAATTDACPDCHGNGGIADVAAKHLFSAPAFPTTAELSLSPPNNGLFYAGSEQPVVTITIKDSNGAPVAPSTITDTSFNTLRFFVHGPRARREPVLTAASTGIGWARALVRSGKQPSAGGGWNLSAATSLDLKIDDVPMSLVLSTALQRTGVVADDVVAWLNADPTFNAKATALKSVVTSGSSAGTYVQIKSNQRGATSAVEVPASPGQVQAVMAWPTARTVAVPGSYALNDLRLHPLDPAEDTDPRVTRMATSYQYLLDSVSSLEPGTYVTSVMVRKASSDATKVVWATFQVDTPEEEPKIATNCMDCHESTSMHGSYPFDVDVCGNCHDDERQYAARTDPASPADGWGNAAATGRSNQGFGAAPISRRVHGVHFLRYLEKPGQVHSSFAADAEIIFPQDVRNCVKCHADSDSWIGGASRVACLACHDDESAIAHGAIMTFDPTPLDPWNGDEDESCAVCHGEGDELSPFEVHNVWDPFRPPYLRDPE